MNIQINNPDNLKTGDACFAIHLPSFRPHADARPCLDILHGTLQGDYACKPKDGVQPPAYFLPDAPVGGTDILSNFYHISDWTVCRNKTDAEKIRNDIAAAAILAWRDDIIMMGEIIGTDDTNTQQTQFGQVPVVNGHVYTHDVAAVCIEAFENLLDAKDIDIPCGDPDEESERHEDDNSARLYGTEYSDLLDAVEAIICDTLDAHNSTEGTDYVRDMFSGHA